MATHRLTRTVTVEGSAEAIAAWRQRGYRAHVETVGVPVAVMVGLGPGEAEMVEVTVTETVEEVP